MPQGLRCQGASPAGLRQSRRNRPTRPVATAFVISEQWLDGDAGPLVSLL
ncbi:hypothetical protein ACMHYB_55545 [Sorangium sp. So ce1128]